MDALGMGIRFSLDDFGTGYSSLTHLKALPAHTIKIDQSFVRGMIRDPSDKAIVVGIVGLANAFNRYVVAEGVEDEPTGALLLSVGCKVAQGYTIAPPMPPEKIEDWKRSGALTHPGSLDSTGKATNVNVIADVFCLATNFLVTPACPAPEIQNCGLASTVHSYQLLLPRSASLKGPATRCAIYWP